MKPTVVISDTSVIIDLERGEILETAFTGRYQLAVPDILFERELRPHGGDRLLQFGLQTLGLDGDGLELSAAYRSRDRRLSFVDSLAVAVAKQRQLMLLTGDGILRDVACADGIDCHGLLWLLDALEEDAVISQSDLANALARITAHPRCRLPRSEVADRLARYRC